MDNFSNFSQEKTNPFQGVSESLDISFEADDSDLLLGIKDSEFRLNDYDSNLLSEGAYKKLDNELFKLEYKIGRLEKRVKALSSQLEVANTVDDSDKIQFLRLKKSQCESELNKLYELYRSQSLPSNLSEHVISGVLFIPEKLVELSKFLVKKLNLSKLLGFTPKQAKSNFYDALLALENINKNVDELVSLRAPYGESVERYEQLLNYLNKANKIQAQISKLANSKKK